jgi:predicted RNase H-like HicB family nuclease
MILDNSGYDARMTQRTFTAVIHREQELYVADCPEVGTVSQGRSVEEALENLREATELYLEEFPLPDSGTPVAPSTHL